MRPERGWRLETKLLVLTLPLIVAVTGLAAWAVNERNTANLQEKLTHRARSLHTQIMADRQYYASVIVPRLIELGGSMGPDYKQVHGRFPLPATFVREVAELTTVASDGYTANLISPGAINKDKGLRDQFHQDAFAYLMKNPTGQFFRADTSEGRAVMRVLMADLASAQSCVDCHNAHPSSPRHDFKLNDLMGGLEIVIPMDQYVKEIRLDFLLTLTGGAGLCLLVMGIVVFGTRQTVTRPLARLAERMRTFTGGEKGPFTRADAVSLGDEMARLDETFGTMVETITCKENELRDANARLEQRVVERTRALQALEERYLDTMASLPVSVVRLGRDRTIRFANRAFYDLVRRHPEDSVGRSIGEVLPVTGLEEYLQAAPATGAGGGTVTEQELECAMPTGERWVLRLTASGIRRADDDDDDDDFVLVIEDMTEHRRIEERLRQSQKLEAVGQLAGGIAHDFNNLLTAILGSGEIMLAQLSDADALRLHLEEIKTAVRRGSALTRQLLAFSRRQVLQPTVLEVSVLVTDMARMLHRLIGEDIELSLALGTEQTCVKADRGQLEQVLLNLAINARDAMPGGGRLTIETRGVSLEAPHCPPTLSPGRYARLIVRDTGCGMDATIRARIFEPFFTTKEMGKGTGLGLATVHGIVEQSGGAITVESAPGLGTTFTVYLPAVTESPLPEAPGRSPAVPPTGSETVLLVEDDDLVRGPIAKTLRLAGYTVLVAAGPAEALQMAGERGGVIHLLVTDVVMPQMNGRDLAHRVTGLHPRIKVLYMSGYTDDVLGSAESVAPTLAFLQKPFTLDDLARKVRDVLDSP